MRSELGLSDTMEVGASVDAATGQKAPKKVGRKRKRSEVNGESPERDEKRINIEEKDPKRKVGPQSAMNCLGTRVPTPAPCN